MKKEVYDYPPDLQKCRAHRLATRIFKDLEQDEDGVQCVCCGRRVGVETADTSCVYSDSQLAFLGPGLPLFFTYIKASILILVVLSVIFCLFAVISNVLGKGCQNNVNCKEDDIFSTLSIVNKFDEEAYMSVQNYVLLGFVVFFLPLMQVIRYVFRKVEADCDSVTESPSDYAVILKRLPPGTTLQDIQKMIEWRREQLSQQERDMTLNLAVQNIVMAYEMGDYLRKIQHNKSNYKKSIKEGTEFEFEPLPSLNTPSRMAVIIFTKQKSKDYFIYEPYLYQRFCYCLCDPCVPLSDFEVNGHPVAVERAPEPDDIKWENASVTFCGGIWRKIFYSFLTILLLLAGGAAQYGLAVLQNRFQKQGKSDTLVFIMGTVSSVGVSIMNIIVLQFLYFTSTKERNETETDFNKSLIIKISFFQFVNAGIFIVLANILADPGKFSIQDIEGTFPDQVTQIMILNAITPQASLIGFDYFDVFGRIQRWIVRRNKLVLLQIEANKLYEKPMPSLPYKYGYIIRTLWLTAFYCPLVPIVVPISALGLLLNFWIEKCLHAKSYRCPNMVSGMVNATATELLEYIPIILCLGEFLIYLHFEEYHIDQIPTHWAVPIYLSISISVLYLLMPFKFINKKLFTVEEEEPDQTDYQHISEKFDVTYEMVNPAYECKKRRKRDKNLLRTIFGKMDALKEIDASNNTTMQEHLISPHGNEINPALLLFKPNAHNLYYGNEPHNPYPQINNLNGMLNPSSLLKPNPNMPEAGPQDHPEAPQNLFDVLLQGHRTYSSFNSDRYI